MKIYIKLARFPSSVGTSPVRLLPPMNISEMISMRTLDSRRNKSSTHNYIYNAQFLPISRYSRLVMFPRADGIGPSNGLFPIKVQQTVART